MLGRDMTLRVCVCACVCVRVRACLCVCVCACVQLTFDLIKLWSVGKCTAATNIEYPVLFGDVMQCHTATVMQC